MLRWFARHPASLNRNTCDELKKLPCQSSQASCFGMRSARMTLHLLALGSSSVQTSIAWKHVLCSECETNRSNLQDRICCVVCMSPKLWASAPRWEHVRPCPRGFDTASCHLTSRALADATPPLWFGSSLANTGPVRRALLWVKCQLPTAHAHFSIHSMVDNIHIYHVSTSQSSRISFGSNTPR